MPAALELLDTTVQELRVEARHAAFVQKLARVVSALGVIPNLPARDFSEGDMVRLRQLVEETVEAIERRIDSGAESETAQQHLAGSVYEIRRRMEGAETWFRHFAR